MDVDRQTLFAIILCVCAVNGIFSPYLNLAWIIAAPLRPSASMPSTSRSRALRGREPDERPTDAPFHSDPAKTCTLQPPREGNLGRD